MYRQKKIDGVKSSPHKRMYQEIRTQLKDYKLPIITDKIRLVILFELKGKKNIDIDNLARGIINCLEGILYKNDNQIYELFLKKQMNCPEDIITVKYDTITENEDNNLDIQETPQIGQLL